LFNEGVVEIESALQLAAAGEYFWLDAQSAEPTRAADLRFRLEPHQMKLFAVER
jgi:hypothetical protein